MQLKRLLTAALLLHATRLTAASLTYDSSGANPASPVDGPGTWDTSTPLWSNGTTDLPWNNANNDTAVFGNSGPGSTVNIDPAGVTAANITFHPYAGPFPYVLTGGPITLSVGLNTISTPNSGVVPVIASPLVGPDGKGRFVTFSGAITLSASANSYLGRTTVTNTNVIIGSGGNQAYSAPFGGAGNMLTLDTSTLTANGSTTGGSVSYQLPYNIKIIGNNTIFTGKNFTLGSLSSTLYTVQGSGTLTFNSNNASGTNNISSSFSGAGIDAFTGTLRLTTSGGNPVKLNPPNALAQSGNFLGVPNGTLDLQAAVSPQTTGQPYTFSFGALTGNGQLGGGFTNATIATYSVGSLNLSTTFSGRIIGNAALTLTGGSLTLSTPAFNPHTYTGPTTISAGTLILTANNLTATSSISVASGATLRLNPGASVNTSLLTLPAGSTLDITTNPLTFTDSTLPGHDSATHIAAIATAYHNGAWDSPGITSSSAANDPTHSTAIGYSVTGGTLTLKYTYYGDANLDGKITADDYALLDKGYAVGGSTWTQGDFNYDHTIDQNDYLLIDRAFALQSGPLSSDFLSERQSQFGDAYVSNLLASLPEPSTIALLLATTLSTRRARRRPLR